MHVARNEDGDAVNTRSTKTSVSLRRNNDFHIFQIRKIHFWGCLWGAQNSDSRRGSAATCKQQMQNAENGETWTMSEAKTRKSCFAEARRLFLMAAEENGNSRNANM